VRRDRREDDEHRLDVLRAIESTGKVDLPEVESFTGEEEEDLIYKQRAKLYRFRDNQWKERGLGEFKLLRHKETKKIRFILRQEKTLKVKANLYVASSPLCDLEVFQGSEKAFSFTAVDFSDGTESKELFVTKFGSKRSYFLNSCRPI
jgi:hypothetical protein